MSRAVAVGTGMHSVEVPEVQRDTTVRALARAVAVAPLVWDLEVAAVEAEAVAVVAAGAADRHSERRRDILGARE